MPKKRLDIQGLRAIAVALVVTYHLWPWHVPGGFVGVDVFFVISGFLITQHLLKEVVATGTVSLPKFWARRVRRLLPAAFTVLLVSYFAALLLLPKSVLYQSLQQIIGSALYVVNWVLAANSVDYLAADNNPTLVQHFWSLSIEEQFYVLWPLLIVLALWVGSRFRKVTRTGLVASTLSLVFVVSLVYSAVETARSPETAYFELPTRMWEFAAGGLLACIPVGFLAMRSHLETPLKLALSWVGLIAIVASALTFTGDDFPGLIALVPVLGAVFMLAGGESDSAWSPTRALSIGPVQFLGGISYAVYLWHWGLIVMFPYVTGHELTFRDRLMIIAFTLGLSILTKYFIEDPVLGWKGRAARPARSFAFMAAGLVVVVGLSATTLQVTAQTSEAQRTALEQKFGTDVCLGAGAMANKEECPRPFSVTDVVSYAFLDPESLDSGIDISGQCDYDASDGWKYPSRTCEFVTTDNPEVTLAFVGDSHAGTFNKGLAEVAVQRSWNVVTYTRPGCNGVTAAAGQSAEQQAVCETWGKEVRQLLLDDPALDLVLFANYSGYYSSSEDAAAAYFAELESAGRHVAILRDFAGMPSTVEGLECVERSIDTYDPCTSPVSDRTDFMQQAAHLADVPVIDLARFLCDPTLCHAVIGELIVFHDDNHLSGAFARTLAPYLADEIVALPDR